MNNFSSIFIHRLELKKSIFKIDFLKITPLKCFKKNDKKKYFQKIKNIKDKDIFKQSFTRIEGEANDFEYDHI